MLSQRIIGALTFKKEVYADVEKDTSFTQTAWLIVVVVSILSSIGTRAGLISGGIGGWIIGVIVGSIFSVIGFALGCFVISWLGKTMFKADVNFEEMVRVLGLAYVWNTVAVLGIFGALIPFLSCILAPVQIIAGLAGLAAWLIAAKEALDLEWLQTIITVVVGFVVNLIVVGIATAILSLFGIAATGVLQSISGG
jgi:hypothetical protein